MKANKQFTIRLANGREETFDNASAMVEWMDRQRWPGIPRQSKSIETARVRQVSLRRRHSNTQTKLLWHGTRIGTAAKLKPSCLRVRVPPVLLEMNWRNNTARSSIGRTPVSHAGKMSSILIRVTEQTANTRVGEHW